MSPQFAPVGPLKALRRLANEGQLGAYHLLIAPQILNDSWAYGEFFWEQHPNTTVIVDNGVIEQGYSLDIRRLVDAARNVGATAVILPDTIDDAKFTMKQVRFAMRDWGRFAPPDSALAAIGVVQGVTFEECMECAKSHVEAGVDWLAVPRGLTPHLGTRVDLVKTLADEHGLPIHVLGFSDLIMDDIRAAASHRLVQGIDAATPMWCTRILPALAPMAEAYSLSLGKRPAKFWESMPPDVAAGNVVIVRQWLSDAVAARIAREGLVDLTGRRTLLSQSSERHPAKKSSEPTDPSLEDQVSS